MKDKPEFPFALSRNGERGMNRNERREEEGERER